MINKIFGLTGYKIISIQGLKYIKARLKTLNRASQFKNFPNLDPDFKIIANKLEKIFNYNVFTHDNYSIYQLTKNIINKNVHGSIVECGVYKGVKLAFVIETLKLLNSLNKNLFFVDTYSGHTEISQRDQHTILKDLKKMEKNSMSISIEEVKSYIDQLGYDKNLVHYVQLDVRKTLELKEKINDQISILSLDTNFYDSVLSSLRALYDKVNTNGYIIHDDYGVWQGHFDACNKFYEEKKIKPTLIRTSQKECIEIKN